MMPTQINVLVIEDRKADFLMVEGHLRQKGLAARCSQVDSLEGLAEALAGETWDLVLADYNMPAIDFQVCLALLLARLPDVPVILVTGCLGEEKAVELLKLGVWDFVLKDNLSRLVSAIERGLRDALDRRARCDALDALGQSEEMHRSLFDNMLSGFSHCRMIFDGETPLDFVYLKVNDAFEKQTGLRNVVGKRVTEVIPGIRKSDPELFDRFCRVALTGVSERFEIYLESLDTWFWISAYCPSKGHFITVFDVITERKLAEQALRDSEERLGLALRGANGGLWDWNLKTGAVYYSPSWKSMLGYADGELENRYSCWEQRLHPDDREPTLERLHDFLEGRTAKFEVEFRMQHKAGHYVDIMSRAFLHDDHPGEPGRMVGAHVDVTERKKLEVQYRQAQKMEAVGQLAGRVAHDFNNMLSAILGYSQLVQGLVQDNDAVSKYMEEIIKASVRAAELTEGLLAFSRKQPVILAVIDLGEVIKGLEGFFPRLVREDIELKIHLAAEPLRIMADRGQIEQVLMNLVANSRDAMPEGGKLSIEARPVTLDQEFIATQGYGSVGAYSVFTVSDSGFGMDKETKSRIFEPFYTMKQSGQGTGLGLSMAFGIVKKHEGFINVYSEPGEGTTISVYLPRIQEAVREEQREQTEAAPLRGGTETILVVEDDAALRRLSTRVLDHYGYRVIEAVDGQDAVDKFLTFHDCIDLVILDVIMPKKNGKIACDEMKILRPGLKTIFTSGYARDIMAEGTILDANTDFIHKPISSNDLVAKVRRMLDGQRRQIPAATKSPGRLQL